MGAGHAADDDNGFAEALAREAGPVRQWLSRRAHDEADDLLQETMARAWRHRGSYDAARPLGPWLHQTARSVLVEHLRAQGRRPELQELGEAAEPERSDMLAERELVARLVASLVPVERSCLLRFHQHGESLEEIAAALGLPLGTVKSHLHRARRKLAQRGGP